MFFKMLNRVDECTVILSLQQVNLIAEAVATWKIEFLADGGSTHEKKYKDMEAISRSLDLEIMGQMR